LGVLLLATNRASEAEPLYHRTLQILSTTLVPIIQGHWRQKRTCTNSVKSKLVPMLVPCRKLRASQRSENQTNSR
jgi:hypothetical protein